MILLVALALADPRLWLQGSTLGQVGAADPAELGGGVAGEIGVNLGETPVVALSAGASEAVITSPTRHAAGIYVDLRWPARAGVSGGPYLLGGFAHQHVTAIDILLDHPGAVIAASHPDVSHRTGFSVGAGWLLPSFWEGEPGLERVHAELRGRMVVAFSDAGPGVGGLVEIGGRIRVGKD